MVSIISHDRPDPRFYVNIVQGDDGNWSSDQMPLDDIAITKGLNNFTAKGLRTLTKDNIDNYTQQYILSHAPDYAQRNALYVLSTETTGTDFDDANAMFTWINAVRAENDTLKTAVDSMTFDQLVVYVIASSPWPPPPSSLGTTSQMTLGQQRRMIGLVG